MRREKQTVGTYHTHTKELYVLCQIYYFYALCNNYEFKYIFKLHSVDVCALSHTSLLYMYVNLKLRVQMYIIICSHLCNVSRFLTIVCKERTINDVCHIVKYIIFVIENLISTMYFINLCNYHDVLCLFTRNT